MIIDWNKGLTIGILAAIIYLVFTYLLDKAFKSEYCDKWVAFGIFVGNFVIHAFIFPLFKK